MKCTLSFLLLAANILQAQTLLSFDKHFTESEDHWVAYPMGNDSAHIYGFVYIDAQAGLTLNYEGRFKVTSDGHFIPKKMDSVSLKYRLEPSSFLVAFIPESRYDELKIKAVPEWLKYYKTDTAAIERLYKWGFTYNGWDQCAKALTYLQKAEKIDPNYKGLAVELAFSYNCLGRYEEAVTVLLTAISVNPTDAYINKELIYAQIKSGQLTSASESCKRAIAVCPDKSYNGENCYNLLHIYYLNKDRINFYNWLEETKKWTKENAKLTRSIEAMENDLPGK
jgi:tetratricopeptide (TPR) repeat protein